MRRKFESGVGSSLERCRPELLNLDSRNYTKALYGFDAVVQRVPADQWDEAAPCDGWSAERRRRSRRRHSRCSSAGARTGENALPETPDPGDDPVGLWNSSRDTLLKVLDEPGLVGKGGNYWFGESTIVDILAFSQWDPLIHSSDLGQAVGLESDDSTLGFDRAEPVQVDRHQLHRLRFAGIPATTSICFKQLGRRRTRRTAEMLQATNLVGPDRPSARRTERPKCSTEGLAGERT